MTSSYQTDSNVAVASILTNIVIITEEKGGEEEEEEEEGGGEEEEKKIVECVCSELFAVTHSAKTP